MEKLTERRRVELLRALTPRRFSRALQSPICLSLHKSPQRTSKSKRRTLRCLLASCHIMSSLVRTLLVCFICGEFNITTLDKSSAVILLLFTIVAILEHPQETVFEVLPSSSLLQHLHLIRKFSIIFSYFFGYLYVKKADEECRPLYLRFGKPLLCC